jgi:hydrophobic/amphiphilic exporter-1 (mainly G- bacteria), HAE1 family
MFISDASVRRPIAVACLIIALTLLGINAGRKMGVELMPKIDAPYITITTIYPGAGPEEIEADVAKPIEDQVLTIEGLKHATSTCIDNVAFTFLEFNLDVDVDIAATDVREKIDLIRSDFPDAVEDPRILKYDINAKPIIELALTGDAPVSELYAYADDFLRNRITVIQGVADVRLIGGAPNEIQILLDRDKLAARGITALEVAGAVGGAVRTIPSGRIKEQDAEYAVKFDADFDVYQNMDSLEISGQNGSRCYIKDIGRVRMAPRELRQAATIGGRPCIALKAIKKSDANAVYVARLMKEAIKKIDQDLPGGMELFWVSDDTDFIKASMTSAWINIGEGILLTAMILFIFLYNLRALLVVVLTMPLTIVISIFFMQFMNLTLNTITLLAMGLSVGILVTNSIVVLEAIVKRLDETNDPKAASRLGTAEVTVAVLASVGTNIVVLFPLSMMESTMGLFMKSFAYTMIILTAVSLLISFTLTPLLCSILLKPEHARKGSRLALMQKKWDARFDRMVIRYRRFLIYLDQHPKVTIAVLAGIVLIFIQSLVLSGSLGTSMVTEPDKAILFVKMEFPTYYDLKRTKSRVAEAEALLNDLPHLHHVFTNVGKVEGMLGKMSEGVHLAQILLKFSEKTDRRETIMNLARLTRSRLANFPGCIISVNQPLIIGGQSTDIEVEIAGDDLAILDSLALQVKTLSDATGDIVEPDTTVRSGKPEIRIRPDRAVLADLGASAVELGMAIRANLEGLTVGSFKQGGQSYDIVVKLEEKAGKSQVGEFLFPGAPGRPLILQGLGTVEETVAPVQITRKDKRRISKLFANLKEGRPLGTVVNKIDAAIASKEVIPRGYDVSFTGMFEHLREAQVELVEAGIIAVILVFLTLSAIMESFRRALVVLVTVPPALIGVFWALFIFGKSLEIFTLMSMIMLLGIVVNNAILIMDRLKVNENRGMPVRDAMIRAVCDRFRPIIMITLAAVMGMLPMAFAQGLGSELRNACGMASAGGILASGILTLLLLPSFYSVFTKGEK